MLVYLCMCIYIFSICISNGIQLKDFVCKTTNTEKPGVVIKVLNKRKKGKSTNLNVSTILLVYSLTKFQLSRPISFDLLGTVLKKQFTHIPNIKM